VKLKNRGFALIELLIVLAVVGIFAAVMLFTYREQLEKKRDPVLTDPSEIVEYALAKVPEGSCYFGVDGHAQPSDIAAFLNKHPEFKVFLTREATAQGMVFKRINCGER